MRTDGTITAVLTWVFCGQVIELDYSEADQDSTGEEAANTEKQLVYYQLDLGLNHVTRLWSDPISR